MPLTKLDQVWETLFETYVVAHPPQGKILQWKCLKKEKVIPLQG